MSSRPDQKQRIKDCKKYAAVLREDKDFLIFEIEKRDRVIKILADAIKNRHSIDKGYSNLDESVVRGKDEFEKIYEDKK